MEELQLYEEIVRLKRERRRAALVTVVESAGSTPRKAGAKMLVREDATTLGTIGGGKVEAEMAAEALAVLREGRPRTRAFTFTEEHGLACGGRMLVYLEPLEVAPQLLVVGKGHVARALAEAAPLAGFRTVCLDPPADPEGNAPGAGLETALAACGASGNDWIVVATPSHRQDFVAARAALRTPAPYVGVIGSRRKRAALLDFLAAAGCTEQELARIVTPVGLAIGAQTPAEIAVSIVAQLIQLRRSHAAGDGDRPGRGALAADGAVQAAPAAG